VNDIDGKQAVVLRDAVLDFKNQKVLFNINQKKTGDRCWGAFADQVLWQSNDPGGNQEKSEWVNTKIGCNNCSELWRTKYAELGVLLTAYSDGIGIFYNTKSEQKKFPGFRAEVPATEFRAVQLSGKKKVLWSQVMRGHGMHRNTGYADILRQHDILLHQRELYGAKGCYDTKPFIGLTAQHIRTGKIEWAKSIRGLYLLAEGDGRFWVLVESEDNAKNRQVIAFDAETGNETVSIPVVGSGYCVAVEHQGMLALLVGKTLFGYQLTES
jgi:hypothetical protein